MSGAEPSSGSAASQDQCGADASGERAAGSGTTQPASRRLSAHNPVERAIRNRVTPLPEVLAHYPRAGGDPLMEREVLPESDEQRRLGE